VIGAGLLAGQPASTVAVPVRLGDPSVSALLRAGDRVDVLRVSSSAWSAQPNLADGTALPGDPGGSGDSSGDDSSGGVTGTTAPPPTGSLVVGGALVLAVPGVPGADEGSGSEADSGGLGGLGGDLGSGSAGGQGSGSDGSAAGLDGVGVILLAVNSVQAARLASAQAGGALTVVILPAA
jgi:hypothetical protein